SLFLIILAPILYILGLNALGVTSPPIALTLANWILVFLAEILVLIIFLVSFLILYFGMAPIMKNKNAALIALIIVLLLLPIIFIFAVSLVVGVAIGYTLESYVLVFALIIIVALISGALEYIFYRCPRWASSMYSA